MRSKLVGSLAAAALFFAACGSDGGSDEGSLDSFALPTKAAPEQVATTSASTAPAVTKATANTQAEDRPVVHWVHASH